MQGCKQHNDCFSCPFDDCIADDRLIRLPRSIIEDIADLSPIERRKAYMQEYLKRYSKTSQYRRYQRKYKHSHSDVEHNREIQKAFRERHKNDEEWKARRREINRKYRERKNERLEKSKTN